MPPHEFVLGITTGCDIRVNFAQLTGFVNPTCVANRAEWTQLPDTNGIARTLMEDFERAKQLFFDGLSLMGDKNFLEAERMFLESLALVPDRVSTLSNLAATQIKLGKFDEARLCARKALALDETSKTSWLNLALIEDASRNLNGAMACLDRALQIDPDYAEAWSNKGNVLSKLERHEEAMAHYDKAMQVKPDYAQAWFNKGNALHKLERRDEAMAHYDKAIQLKPDYADAWSNKGNNLSDLERYDEAMAHYDQAIQIKRDHAEAWFNKGNALCNLKRHEEAIAHYDQALIVDPQYLDADWNRTLAQLTLGNFKDGWNGYECRWKNKNGDTYRHAELRFPDNLQELTGKRVLVWDEQGYGDTIQFSRYIKKVIEVGANITFEVQKPLKDLIEESISGCAVISRGEPFESVDFQIPLLSLPLLFGTDLTCIPAQQAYLLTRKERVDEWADKLALSHGKMNIGIACSGSEAHKNDKNRSMMLKYFEPLTRSANLFLIQKDVRAADSKFLTSYPAIRFTGDDIESFMDSAAIVGAMDLIISVDTSLAHLAGALGKPVYILLPWICEWRWLLDRDDSPWYPTARIFRQPSRNDWGSVIHTVGKAIASRK